MSSKQRLPAGRRADIASRVAELGQVTVSELAEHFSVSLDTVRRDLDLLDQQGILIRTHGGAVSLTTMTREDMNFDVRVRIQASAKEAIGALAAKFVKDGSVIAINGGSTSLALARHLHEHRDLTIVTNNLRLPGELSPKVARDLHVFGGDVRQSAQVTIGPVRLQSLVDGSDTEISCDVAFIAVGGVKADSYLMSSIAEAAMMRELAKCSAITVVMADSSKMGRSMFAKLDRFDVADYFITDREPPEELRASLVAAGVEIVLPG